MNHYPDGTKQVPGAIETRRPDLTLGENIDQQITMAKNRVAELEATKKRLESSGLLNTRITDIQQAMSW